jgi:hypothetical protein
MEAGAVHHTRGEEMRMGDINRTNEINQVENQCRVMCNEREELKEGSEKINEGIKSVHIEMPLESPVVVYFKY